MNGVHSQMSAISNPAKAAVLFANQSGPWMWKACSRR